MRTAIDRMHSGKEKEVDISDYDGYKQENRFVCPECGEYVYPAVGMRSAFRHFKKKDIECDRRVDGQVSCTYYERVGLPLHLHRNNNIFELKMGFAPLNERLLNSATSQRAQVIVSAGANSPEKSIFDIDSIGFMSDSTTFKTIDFVPIFNNNYEISISDRTLEKQILKHWSNYADGFTSYGALFVYSENGGKKVRKNDTIEANITYYWLVPQGYFKYQNGLDYMFEAILTLQNKLFDIYSISVQHKSESEFKHLEYFFWNYLRVRLLYTKPAIIPIWPPVIQTENCALALNVNPKNTSVFCGVKSDNDKPIIYKYSDKEFSIVSVHGGITQPQWTNLNLNRLPQPFTIDRKYLANSIVICQKPFSIATDTGDILSISSDNGVIPFEKEITVNRMCRDVFIRSTKKVIIIHFSKRNFCGIIEITTEQDSAIFKNVKNLNIWAVEKISGNIICKIIWSQESRKPYTSNMDDACLLEIIRKSAGESSLPIPRKYKSLVRMVKKYPQSYMLLASNILKGKIQPSVLSAMVAGGIFNERN